MAVLQLRSIRPRRLAGLVNWFSGRKSFKPVSKAEPPPEQTASAPTLSPETNGNGVKPEPVTVPEDENVKTPQSK